MKFSVNLLFSFALLVKFGALAGPVESLDSNHVSFLERRTLDLIMKMMGGSMSPTPPPPAPPVKTEEPPKPTQNTPTTKTETTNEDVEIEFNNTFDTRTGQVSTTMDQRENSSTSQQTGDDVVNTQNNNIVLNRQPINTVLNTQTDSTMSNNQVLNNQGTGFNTQVANSASNNRVDQQANRTRAQNYQQSCSSSNTYTCRTTCGFRNIATTRTCSTTNGLTKCFEDPGCNTSTGDCASMYDPSECFCSPMSCNSANYGPGTSSDPSQGNIQSFSNNNPGNNQPASFVDPASYQRNPY